MNQCQNLETGSSLRGFQCATASSYRDRTLSANFLAENFSSTFCLALRAKSCLSVGDESSFSSLWLNSSPSLKTKPLDPSSIYEDVGKPVVGYDVSLGDHSGEEYPVGYSAFLDMVHDLLAVWTVPDDHKLEVVLAAGA